LNNIQCAATNRPPLLRMGVGDVDVEQATLAGMCILQNGVALNEVNGAEFPYPQSHCSNCDSRLQRFPDAPAALLSDLRSSPSQFLTNKSLEGDPASATLFRVAPGSSIGLRQVVLARNAAGPTAPLTTVVVQVPTLTTAPAGRQRRSRRDGKPTASLCLISHLQRSRLQNLGWLFFVLAKHSSAHRIH
jgi:hypothetical protein